MQKNKIYLLIMIPVTIIMFYFCYKVSKLSIHTFIPIIIVGMQYGIYWGSYFYNIDNRKEIEEDSKKIAIQFNDWLVERNITVVDDRFHVYDICIIHFWLI